MNKTPEGLKEKTKEIFDMERKLCENLACYLLVFHGAIINNMDRIAELAKEAEDDKYERLFDAMAELAYSGSSKQLQAVIDEIIDDHLEAQAEKEWEAGDEL